MPPFIFQDNESYKNHYLPFVPFKKQGKDRRGKFRYEIPDCRTGQYRP